MPPFRNPFGRKPVANSGTPSHDENTPPTAPNGLDNPPQRPDLSASRTSSALSIKKNKEEPDEFKLSVVNDNGVYLPPSPPERKGFWRRTPTSTTTSSHRSMLSENEPFSISRESFESYRRSFDISARSPVFQPETTGSRQSLDLRVPRLPRSAVNGTGKFERPQPTDEEGFEESQMMGRDRAQATAGFIFLVENGGKADKERNLGKLIGRVVKDLTMVL
ncbi:hypothetical protein MMC24_000220 [Lignoscripta atroalba]|nr:hypothetical protein [Lignoscripta atroalba]